ncbi:MAG: ATP-binding protein, partial [Chloroflexota bacterium]|nr:ATP-binding protein [Chloroflexota bacterium]
MSDDSEILPVEIHLPGLLKLLGESLYSTPRVALRELVQNAHDSCVRRREEDPQAASDYAPAIHIWADREARQLFIEDNGSGLTREEITVFLATVGRGYTSELRSRLGAGGRDEALELIGFFGLGLLSAFMIAQRVQITTCSYQAPDEAWLWVSEGGQSYALRRATRASVGTTVQLDVRDDALFLLDTGALADTLRTYAELLPVPITIGKGGEVINAQPAPWMLEEGDQNDHTRAVRYAAWVRERLDPNALAILPLDDAHTADGATIPLRGALYVPERSIISIREYGDVAVYVRRMLITERERDLLPDWARFVTGVIECPLLNPTASRETLRHDEIFDAVRESVATQLLAFFERLATDAPLDWEAVVRAHNDLIKGWAVRSYDLFTRVADLVTFRTSRGELTIPDYLRENPGRIFYYEEEDGLVQALTLFEARRLAVIDARWFADVAFLKRYGELYGTQ